MQKQFMRDMRGTESVRTFIIESEELRAGGEKNNESTWDAAEDPLTNDPGMPVPEPTPESPTMPMPGETPPRAEELVRAYEDVPTMPLSQGWEMIKAERGDMR
jgi:hypothetical protein